MSSAAAQIAAESALRTIAREIDAAIAAAPVVPAGIADEGIVAVAREVVVLHRAIAVQWSVVKALVAADDNRRHEESVEALSLGREFDSLNRTAAPAPARYVLAHAALIGGPLREWRDATRDYHKDAPTGDGTQAQALRLDAAERALLAALDSLATAVTR